MPRKLYRGAGALAGRVFISTGAFRPPRVGEAYLSAARAGPPAAYRASAANVRPAAILREAREDEARCACCGHPLLPQGEHGP